MDFTLEAEKQRILPLNGCEHLENPWFFVQL
jgi:hypothetical protein